METYHRKVERRQLSSLQVSMKAKSEALDCCEVHSSVKQKCWKENPDVMASLNGLYK